MTMLGGFTLLDFSRIGPGPRCTRLLADYGMRVVKIGPPVSQTRMIEAPWYSYSANRGIPQVAIDLRQDAGRQLVRRLVARADAMLESFRPGVAARLGIGYPDAAGANEQIVYCSLSGYGQRGPYATWPAYDINWLALGGLLDATSRAADGSPAVPGGAVADSLGAHSAAVAILTALVQRAATGQGAYLDVAVIDSVLRTMRTDLDAHLASAPAELPDATSLSDLACYAIYQTADGGWLAVGALEPHFWAELYRRLGLDQLISAQRRPGRTSCAAPWRPSSRPGRGRTGSPSSARTPACRRSTIRPGYWPTRTSAVGRSSSRSARLARRSASSRPGWPCRIRRGSAISQPGRRLRPRPTRCCSPSASGAPTSLSCARLASWADRVLRRGRRTAHLAGEPVLRCAAWSR